ncbi:MAG: hypothetical protein HRT53_06460 [Colwellia sp.]|nr:hypothetical protein [Colwellia sp.]
MFRTIISVVFITSVLISCQLKSEQSMHKFSSEQPGLKEVSFTATVKYIKVEGGFYGLLTKDGQRWLPMNLKNKFKQNGTVIKVVGHEINDMMTIQQWGKPFSITDIQLIKVAEKGMVNNKS